MITYIQFIAEISVGGNHNAISYWSRDKHAQEIQVEEKGSWLILVLGKTVIEADAKGETDGAVFKPSGTIRRVPITNVAFISESRELVADKSKGKVL